MHNFISSIDCNFVENELQIAKLTESSLLQPYLYRKNLILESFRRLYFSNFALPPADQKTISENMQQMLIIQLKKNLQKHLDEVEHIFSTDCTRLLNSGRSLLNDRQIELLQDRNNEDIQIEAENESSSSSSSNEDEMKFVSQPKKRKRKNKSNDTTKRSRCNFSEEARLILLEWFLNHSDHPYPKQSEKEMLAKKTGLSVEQVKVWFVNTRTRKRIKT